MTKICQICKKEFNAYRPQQRYCSKICASMGRAKDPNRRYDKIKRETIVNFLGAYCASCGYDKDIRALQLDHINGNGAEEIRRFSNGKPARGAHGRRNYVSRYYYKNLDEAKIVLQVLCANCNAIKKDDQEEWPSKQNY